MAQILNQPGLANDGVREEDFDYRFRMMDWTPLKRECGGILNLTLSYSLLLKAFLI